MKLGLLYGTYKHPVFGRNVSQRKILSDVNTGKINLLHLLYGEIITTTTTMILTKYEQNRFIALGVHRNDEKSSPFPRARKNRVFPPHWNSHEEPFILSWHPFFLTPRKSRLGDGSSHGIEKFGGFLQAMQIRRRLQRWNLDPFIAPKHGSENSCVQPGNPNF
ncbi:hypothetical protein V1478_011920 [Vespula squamosa]|uniref:Uncharacterized protein n=1 Tax=Vespula squamosa TaxID=30214 RepID=A0ABD2ABQ9_VESSQ